MSPEDEWDRTYTQGWHHGMAAARGSVLDLMQECAKASPEVWATLETVLAKLAGAASDGPSGDTP